jgi:hypothetical protein
MSDRKNLFTRKMSVTQKQEQLIIDGWELTISCERTEKGDIFHIIFLHNDQQFVVEKTGAYIGEIIRVMYPALLGMRQEKEQTA